MSVINTNVKSIVAQNALTVNNRAMAKTMEQLSTGKRINSSSDDAAGLSIGSKMTAQIKGLNQAVRNANDGISLIQVAEGSLVEVTNMMQRMRELAVQSANDTYTEDDRTALNIEFQELKSQINQIGNNTQWNGTNIMDKSFAGSTGEFKFQVGANADQTISLSIGDFRTTSNSRQLAPVTTTPNVVAKAAVTEVKAVAAVAAVAGVTAVAQEDTLTLGGTFVAGDDITVTNATGGSFTYKVDGADISGNGGNITTYTSIAAKLETAADAAFNTSSITTDKASGGTLVFTAATPGTPNGIFTFTSSPSGGSGVVTTTTNNVVGVTAVTAVAAVAAVAAEAAVTAVAQEDTLSLSGSFAEGDEIKISDGTNNLSYTVLAEDLEGTDAENLDAIAAKLAAKTLTGVTVAAGSDNGTITLTASTAGTPNEDFTLTVERKGRLSDIDDSNILSQTSSNTAIDAIDKSLANVNTARAQMGATINRLTYAADNLTNVSQNTSESRSRIMDTDYAQATTELARTQIISQAATAMLAQANQAPQSVLSLLR